ncbi:MAG: ribonuclease P protein component 2 [Candidatus Lokiarchaeota archaeon]|nr:ribonuclease P protein component 2 [Candidatus Lokiarchaeota archaeon]
MRFRLGYIKMVKLEKHRYIAFEIISDSDEITEENINYTLWNLIYRLFGEYGTSKTGLWMIYYDKENKKGVIRISLNFYEDLRSALALIRKIHEKYDNKTKPKEIKVIFYVLGVSGTIKTIKEKYFFVPKKELK